jgi:hypothetical protein
VKLIAAVKLADADRAVGALLEAAGGADEFLERYDVLLCSDHGQTTVEDAASLEQAYADLNHFRGRELRAHVAVCASNRAGQVYRLPSCREDTRALAERLDGHDAVDTVLFREGDEAVARREREELRFRRDNGGFALSGDASLLDDHPDALARAWAALANPNAGDLLVSAAEGVEFTDLGGRHHAGGGSHGSLCLGDSEVPMLAVGIDTVPASITEIAPAVLAHFGVR